MPVGSRSLIPTSNASAVEVPVWSIAMVIVIVSPASPEAGAASLVIARSGSTISTCSLSVIVTVAPPGGLM